MTTAAERHYWDFPDTEGEVLGARVSRAGGQPKAMVVTKPRQFAGLSWLSADNALLALASILLAGLAVAMGVVSWRAQFTFVYSVKHQHLASALEALGLDAGAVIFAIYGVVLARMKRRAGIERAFVCICAAGSAAMNLLAADLGSPRAIAVYVMPPLLFAATADRLIAAIRRVALGPSENPDARSAWRIAGTASLYALRLPLAPKSTSLGLRQLLLDATPVPSPPAKTPRPAATLPAPAGASVLPGSPPGIRAASPGTKTARFLDLVEAEHGALKGIRLDRVGKIAGELAAEADLHPGSARTALKTAIEKARRER